MLIEAAMQNRSGFAWRYLNSCSDITFIGTCLSYMTLNHVHLGTKNMTVFQDFYRRYFGFEKKFDHGSGAFLENKAGFLIAVDPVETLPSLPAWYHLGFCLDNEAEVHAMYEKMKTGNADIAREMMAEKGSFASFFVKDPDGNKLEISWHAD